MDGFFCTLKAPFMTPFEFTDRASAPQERLAGKVKR